MTGDVPLELVLAAIVPKPRPADVEPCPCAECFEERARDRARADWRALRSGK
jgi:hypothetical protein